MSGAPMSPGAAKRFDRRVNATLQKRGAREERKKRYRPYWILGAFLLVGAPLIAIFTPYYPNKFLSEWKATAYDEETGTVNPDSVKGVYYLGVLYYYTAREPKAVDCWNTITEWRLGVKLTDWANNPEAQGQKIADGLRAKRRNKVNPERELPWKFEGESLHWLALSYIRLAEKFYDMDARTQPAGYIYARIEAEGLDSPDVGLDDYAIERAKQRRRMLQEGWLGW